MKNQIKAIIQGRSRSRLMKKRLEEQKKNKNRTKGKNISRRMEEKAVGSREEQI